MIYLGADHAGFELKEKIKKFLNKKKINYEDLTPKFKEGDDYPEIAFKIGEKVSRDRGNGILFCGSGNGMAIAANKVKGIRAVEAYDRISAKLSREDNDSNILVLGHNRHWTSLLVRRILKYIKHEYRWIVGIILAILGVVHGLF